MMPPMLRLRVTLMLTVLATLLGLLLPNTAVATVAGFFLLTFLPGRALLQPLGIDRHFSAAGRVVLSVAVSLAIVPFFLNPLWHFSHDPLVMLGAVWVAVWIAIRFIRPPDALPEAIPESPLFAKRSTRIAACVVGIIVVASVILPYWPTEVFGYPMASQIHDFIKHHAILDSLERRPLPLGNVFYAEGADAPAYYYHFFYLIPATVRLWTNHQLSIELAFGIASALVALATAGMVYILARRFTGSETRATLAASLVTVIGALDIVPLVYHMIEIGQPVVVLDAWARQEYRVHNFFNQMIWAPQNVSGVLVILVGAYLLSVRGKWRGWLLVGPILGAAVIGSSVWVAIGALPALALLVLTRPKWLPGALVVALLMAMVSLPVLMGYVESSVRPGHGLTVDWPVNRYAVIGRLVGPGVLANVLDLPFMLTIEFGARVLFLPLVTLAMWRKMWRDDGLRWLFFCACLGLGASVVFHSDMRYNAFGQRIVMLPMLFASIMAACAIDSESGPVRWWNPFGWRLDRSVKLRRFVAVVLIAGLPMGFWEAPGSAVRRYVQQRPLDKDERAAFLFMRHELPPDAVVQPDPSEDRAILAQIIRHQLGVIGPQEDVNVFDPLDHESYAHCVEAVESELRTGDDAEHTFALLRRYRITHVFLGTLEADRWSHLMRFDDPRFFEDVFHAGGVRVIALK